MCSCVPAIPEPKEEAEASVEKPRDEQREGEVEES